MPDADLSEFATSVRAPKPQHPQGWEPGVAWNGKTGTITTRPLAEPTPDWSALLTTWGFDPAQFEIIEPVQVRTWDAAIGNGEVRTMWYYRAGLRGKRAPSADVEELIREIRRHRPSPRKDRIHSDSGSSETSKVDPALVVALSDWQLGKQGTEAAVGRVLSAIDGVTARVRELARLGRPISSLYVLGLGDVVEGCDGHYAMQTFQVELNRREQVRLARRLIVKAVQSWASLAPRIVVAAIGGNHGENRKDGAAFTDFGDNDDVAVFEQAAEVFAANPAYGHVSFLIPRNDLTLTLNVAGTIVAIAHGHQARSGPPGKRVEQWWAGQAYGQRPAGDASILVTGHLHHFRTVEDGPRTHFQAPTLDSGSQWFEETAGKPSRAGTLTFTVGPEGWSDLQIVR